MHVIGIPGSKEASGNPRRRPLLTWLAVLAVTVLLGATGIAEPPD